MTMVALGVVLFVSPRLQGPAALVPQPPAAPTWAPGTTAADEEASGRRRLRVQAVGGKAISGSSAVS